jgi:hypothetical protein
MPRNWKRISEGFDLSIPVSDLDKFEPVLDAMEAVFRPLAESLTPETEPATLFQCQPEKLP